MNIVCFKVVNKCERLCCVLVACNCKNLYDSKAKRHQKVPIKWDKQERKHWNRNQSSLVTPVLQHHLSWSSSLQPLPSGPILSIRTFQWSKVIKNKQATWELAYTNLYSILSHSSKTNFRATVARSKSTTPFPCLALALLLHVFFLLQSFHLNYPSWIYLRCSACRSSCEEDPATLQSGATEILGWSLRNLRRHGVFLHALWAKRSANTSHTKGTPLKSTKLANEKA